MTKHTDEFSQIAEPVTCREYTLPRDEKSTDPKGWIRWNTNIGPVLEVTTSYLQCKYGVEIRIESVIKDNSHPWVRISHGLNNLVTDLIDKEYDDNEQETSETKTEVFALRTEVFAFASRSRAKAKPRRHISAWLIYKTLPIHERIWIDVEPGAQSDQAYPVAKSVDRYSSHVIVLNALSHTIRCAYHTAWLKASHSMCLWRALIQSSFHPRCVCLLVCWLRLRSVLLLFSLRRLPLLFLILPVL